MTGKKKGIVFFDIDDTLVDTTSFLYGDDKEPGAFKYPVIKFLSETNFLENPKFQNYDFKCLYDKYMEAYKKEPNGQNHYNKMFLNLGLTHSEIGDLEGKDSYITKILALRHRYRNTRYHKYKRDYVDEVIVKIKKLGYKVGVISEGIYEKQMWKLDFLNLTSSFDIIKIVDLKREKIYRELRKEHSGDLWMIGDKEEKDIIPAKKYGFITIKVPTKKEPSSKEAEYLITDNKKLYQIIDAISDYESKNA